MSNCWIGVVSRAHVEIGVKGGFIQLNHGKKAAVQRLKAGDRIAMYSPKLAFPDGAPLQAFTALGRVTTGEVYQGPATAYCEAFRVDVEFDPVTEAPIKPLLPKLGFIKDKQHWGSVFRFGCLKVPAEDFDVIAQAMGGRLFDEAPSGAAVDISAQRRAVASLAQPSLPF